MGEDIKCNCVLYAKSKVPSLPGGLWTLADKMKIVNSYIPLVGEVAIMNYAYPWGHVGIVVAVNGDKITIEEANFKRCEITRRTGTREELRILGYFRPPDVLVPAQQTPGFPKQVKVIVPALLVRAQPTTSAPLAGSRVLYYGTVITVVGVVDGQTVGNNNKWYKTIRGNYVWSGGVC
jgi:hypothetical protein